MCENLSEVIKGHEKFEHIFPGDFFRSFEQQFTAKLLTNTILWQNNKLYYVLTKHYSEPCQNSTHQK